MKQDRTSFLSEIYNLAEADISKRVKRDDVIKNLGGELSKEEAGRILDYLANKGYIGNCNFGCESFNITAEGVDMIEDGVTEDSQPLIAVHNEGVINTGQIERSALQINSNDSMQINNSNNINDIQRKKLEALLDGLYELEFSRLENIENTLGEMGKINFLARKSDLGDELARERPSVNAIKNILQRLKPIFKALSSSGVVNRVLQMALNSCLSVFGLPVIE